MPREKAGTVSFGLVYYYYCYYQFLFNWPIFLEILQFRFCPAYRPSKGESMGIANAKLYRPGNSTIGNHWWMATMTVI